MSGLLLSLVPRGVFGSEKVTNSIRRVVFSRQQFQEAEWRARS